jgi:uncharacterized membrane protein
VIDNIVKVGRVLFAVSIAALGLQQLIYGDFLAGPFIAPAWLPARALWAYVSGAVFVVSGVGLLVKHRARYAAIALSALLVLLIVFFHASAPGAVLRDGLARTRAFEALALLSIALVLAGVRPPALGRVVFAVTLVVFGIQHFLYVQFVKTVVPAWIPGGGEFWTYFTGVAFIAAGLSIVANVQARLANLLLGLMFFSWVLVLHGPRVVEKLHDGGEWSSFFVALAMCGAAWLLAGAPPNRK